MSDYVPTDWVDDVTPVDAARMDKIEQGIDVNRDAVIALDGRLDAVEPALAGKEDKSAKGAANGYAPLGADSKVPALYLPAAGGSIDYENAWAAGTAYTPGDVVIHNGVEYIAVNPSTGQTPPASPAVAGATVIPLVVVLPSSPFDGQEVDFTDSLTTPTFVWRLRYVAAAPTNKWKFVGGAGLLARIATQEGTSSQSYVDLTTVGPSLTAPLAGEYEVNVMAQHWITAEAATQVRVAAKFGAAATSDADGAHLAQRTGAVSIAEAEPIIGLPFRKTIAAAGTLVKVQYRRDTAPGTVWYSDRAITMIPIAVSG